MNSASDTRDISIEDETDPFMMEDKIYILSRMNSCFYLLVSVFINKTYGQYLKC